MGGTDFIIRAKVAANRSQHIACTLDGAEQ
jgi:hypothetical protein